TRTSSPCANHEDGSASSRRRCERRCPTPRPHSRSARRRCELSYALHRHAPDDRRRPYGAEATLDRGETEFLQQSIDAASELRLTTVVPHFRQAAHGKAWLRRIDFPGMHVEHSRATTLLLLFAQRTARERIRQEPEVRAARGRLRSPHDLCDGHRELEEPSRWPLDGEGARRDTGISVALPLKGEQTRVVDIALFEQHIERPLRSGRDGKAGRPMSAHLAAGEVLENVLGASHLGAELLARA